MEANWTSQMPLQLGNVTLGQQWTPQAVETHCPLSFHLATCSLMHIIWLTTINMQINFRSANSTWIMEQWYSSSSWLCQLSPWGVCNGVLAYNIQHPGSCFMSLFVQLVPGCLTGKGKEEKTESLSTPSLPALSSRDTRQRTRIYLFQGDWRCSYPACTRNPCCGFHWNRLHQLPMAAFSAQ